MGIIAVLIYLFYPPTKISISPIISLAITPAEGIVQLLVLAGLLAFTMPRRTVLARTELTSVRNIAIITAVGYLILSLLPYAFKVPYIQTYVGLIIAFNVLNGVICGALASLFK